MVSQRHVVFADENALTLVCGVFFKCKYFSQKNYVLDTVTPIMLYVQKPEVEINIAEIDNCSPAALKNEGFKVSLHYVDFLQICGWPQVKICWQGVEPNCPDFLASVVPFKLKPSSAN